MPFMPPVPRTSRAFARPLRGSVGNRRDNDPDDVIRVKRRLSDSGYYETPSYGLTGYIDADTEEGLKHFQRDRGLKVDGYMAPGGPTERALIGRPAKVAGNASERDGVLPGARPPEIPEIRTEIGDGRDNDPEDVRLVKAALKMIDLYDDADAHDPGPMITGGTVTGLQQLQKLAGLPDTGRIEPGDPTALLVEGIAREAIGEGIEDAPTAGIQTAALPAAVPALLGAGARLLPKLLRRAPKDKDGKDAGNPDGIPPTFLPRMPEEEPPENEPENKPRSPQVPVPPPAEDDSDRDTPEAPRRGRIDLPQAAIIKRNETFKDTFAQGLEEALNKAYKVDENGIRVDQRGTEFTTYGNKIIAQECTAELEEIAKREGDPRARHTGGSYQDGDGKRYLSERYFGKEGRTDRLGAALADLSFILFGIESHIQSTDIRSSGRLTSRERRNLKRLIENSGGAIVKTIPKFKKGMDEDEYRRRAREVCKGLFDETMREHLRRKENSNQKKKKGSKPNSDENGKNAPK